MRYLVVLFILLGSLFLVAASSTSASLLCPGQQQCYVGISSDSDCDGVADSADNCDCTQNANQLDTDGDHVGDVCETAACIPSTEVCDSIDNDCDAQVDEGGVCSTTGVCTGQTACHVTVNGQPQLDSDCDGIIDSGDNCDCAVNPNQVDTDHDGLGDACDPTFSITKTVLNPTTFREGDTVTYRLVIDNVAATSSNVVVTDSFTGVNTIGANGAFLTYVPASQVINLPTGVTATGTIDNAGVNINGLTTATGPVTITYQATVTTPTLFSGQTQIRNIARLSSGQTATSQVLVQGTSNTLNLALTKTISNANPVEGEIVTYTLTVKNNGQTPATATTVSDSIGDNGGTLTGNNGGSLTFQGTETVVGTRNGVVYSQAYTGSISSTQGLTLTNIPVNGVVTITYQARVSTAGIGNGITSTVFNTARATGAAPVSNRLALAGRNVPPNNPGNDPPYILPIPNQIQTCGLGFGAIDLDDFIGDPETPNNQLLVSVEGNRYFNANLNPTSHVLTVTDPTGVQDNVNEQLRITVRDPEGKTVTRTVTYSILRNTFGKPVVSGIPDQIVRYKKDFDNFDLDEYTQIGGTPLANRTVDYYVTGSSLFDVTIDDANVVRVEYDPDIFNTADVNEISEALTFTMRGCSEAKDTAVFTVTRDQPNDYYYENTGTTKNTCAIVPAPGIVLRDTDCDGVPDPDDNCVDVKNPNQNDNNRDGIGDACDVLLSCDTLVATALDAGKTVSVLIEAQNNMPVEATTIRYTASIDKLGIRDSRTDTGLAYGDLGEATLKLRIPECVTPGSYTLSCSATAAGHTSTATKTVKVTGNSCATNGGNTATIYEMQDVIAGSPYGAVFPIVVENNQDVQRSFIMTVDGVLPWGDYVFEQGGVVVVPANQKMTTSLRVYALPEAELGTYPFKVIVKSGDDQQESILQANVISEDNVAGGAGGVRAAELVWLGLLIIVFGLIIYGAYRAGKGKRPAASDSVHQMHVHHVPRKK